MIISVLTLFPEIFPPVLNSSIIGKAINSRLIDIEYINIRNFSSDKHKTVDDKPYGGGKGMILRVDVVAKAINYAKKCHQKSKEITILLDPKGKIYNQKLATLYAKVDHLILVCGHYEGIDYRIKKFVDQTLSVGEYILTGGEIPAMIVVDSVCRLLPNVLKDKNSIINESFSIKYIHEYPQYTRPEIYQKFRVPKVLLSGNHHQIINWREKKAIKN